MLKLQLMVETKKVPHPWFASRMDALMKQRGVTLRDIETRLGVQYESARKWSRGLSLPEDHRRPALAMLLGVTDAQLFSSLESERGAYHVGIPIAGYVQGGAEDGYFTDMGYEPGDGDGYIALPGISATAYAKRVRGDSMAPKMPSGSFIVADATAAILPGDDVIVHTGNGRCMIKQLLFERNGDITLGSVNHLHAQISMLKSEVSEMHLVLAYLPRGTKLYREKN